MSGCGREEMSGGGEADETRGETGGMNTTAVQELGIGVVSACASAEDPDLALARILQEQERALWLLSYGGGGGGSLEEYEEEDGEEGAVTRNGQEREERGMHVDQTRRRRRVRRSRRTRGVRGGNNENDGNGEGTMASDANVNDNDDDEEEQEEEHEEDVSDYHYEDDALDEDYDPENDDSDEPSVADDAALALRLQQMEDQSTMAGLVAAQLRAVSRVRGTSAGAGAMEGVVNADDDDENHSGNDDDDEDDEDDPHTIDIDDMSYEQLTALGEVVGTVSRGMAVEKMKDVLDECTYADAKVKSSRLIQGQKMAAGAESSAGASKDMAEEAEVQCAICREEYEDNDPVCVLPCGHFYHTCCVREWLGINRSCPICGKEVVEEGVAPIRFAAS